MNWNQAFDKTLDRYGISAKWLSEHPDTPSEITISRFRRGKQPMTTENLNACLKYLPYEAVQYFFESLLKEKMKVDSPSLEEMIEEMSPQQVAWTLKIIANKISVKKAEVALETEYIISS